jgi:hypothetical protein
MSSAEHRVQVSTCELEGDKAVLQYCKTHPDQCKKKLKESPVLGVRLRAIDACARAKGLKFTRSIR